eukprot:c29237_g1_i5 orf=228-1253(-)
MMVQRDVFADGPFSVHLLQVDGTSMSKTSSTHCGTTRQESEIIQKDRLGGPPKPLLLAVPKQEGEYPVVLFLHGFSLLNHHYSQLLHHVASHGFIMIAPQMYFLSGANATQEIADAAAIIDWLPQGLESCLSHGLQFVKPDFQKLALVGHSRGGKVAFGLGLGLSKTSLKFHAVAGLDPVDGTDVGKQTTPRILSFSSHSMDVGCPVLIVGARLGSLKRHHLFPPCAPEGVNHKAFFYESCAPAFYFVASEYGHMDFLDDQTTGIRGTLSYCLCKNGPSRAPMRRFAGGVVVAFFQAALFHDTATLHDLLISPSRAPITLEPPAFYSSARSPCGQLAVLPN